ncbi:hypothetical protein NE237_001484 [Protea cynaroides]|uniref:Uncharacterized protein n=1 Tax=Protea cynaroides TaxID=273540 RepID=A0A9Q0QY50_9MAGN|nr:hypothetical protein NE237_001484 [Protea cynaroides]
MLLLPPAVPTPNGFGNEDQIAMRKKILVQLIQLNAQQNAPIEQFQLIPISNVALLDFFEIIKIGTKRQSLKPAVSEDIHVKNKALYISGYGWNTELKQLTYHEDNVWKSYISEYPKAKYYNN